MRTLLSALVCAVALAVHAEDANEKAFREAMENKDAAKRATGEGKGEAASAKAEEKKPEPPRQTFAQRLQDARAVARKNIKAGVEKALKNHPEVGTDMRATLLSASTHDSWINATHTQTKQAISKIDSKMLSDEQKQDMEINAILTWTEKSAEDWMERSLKMKEQERKSKIASAEEASKKTRKGGENTPPPNGNGVNTPIGGIVGPP